MTKLSDFVAFIFDLDGLVLDTEPTYFAAWQKAVESMGYHLASESFKTMSGYHYQKVVETLQTRLGQEFDLDIFKQVGTEYWLNHIHEAGIAVKKGVIDLLDYAQQQEIPVCLATNSSAVYAHECLAVAGLTQRFPSVVTFDDVAHGKPAPDIFLKAAEKMQVDIRQCIIFEDSTTGVVAALASAAFTVYVPSTFPVNPETVEACDCFLDDLSQVFEKFSC